jgi:hypothetical protein
MCSPPYGKRVGTGGKCCRGGKKYSQLFYVLNYKERKESATSIARFREEHKMAAPSNFGEKLDLSEKTTEFP